MGKPISELEVEIFDWPDRFFVEAEGLDRDYYEFFPQAEREACPHFVDLSFYDTGRCSCRDFRFNVEPYLFWDTVHRRECIHLIAVRSYLARRGSQTPKPMPKTLFS